MFEGNDLIWFLRRDPLQSDWYPFKWISRVSSYFKKVCFVRKLDFVSLQAAFVRGSTAMSSPFFVKIWNSISWPCFFLYLEIKNVSLEILDHWNHRWLCLLNYRTEPNRTEQIRSDQIRTDQSKAEQSRLEQDLIFTVLSSCIS